MKSVLVVLCFVLVGCNTTPVLPPVERQQKIEIDPQLLNKCSGFDDIVPNPQPSEVLAAHASNVTRMKTCQERHVALSNAVRKAFNLSE